MIRSENSDAMKQAAITSELYRPQKVYKRVLETSHLFSQDSPDRGTLELLVSIFDSELKSSIILNDFQAVCVDNFVHSIV